MGEYLSKPDTNKHIETGECPSVSIYSMRDPFQVKFAAIGMQGWRRSMEDAHICNTTLPNGLTLFAVFDGHGGKFDRECTPSSL